MPARRLLLFTGVQFFPFAERDQFIVDVAVPRGSNLYETAAAADAVAEVLREKPGVGQVFTYAGRQIPKFYYNELGDQRGETLAQLLVVTDGMDGQRSGALVGQLKRELPSVFPGATVTPRRLEHGPPVGAPIAVRISGDDLARLRELAARVTDILNRTPGTVNVQEDIGRDFYAVRVNFDAERAARWGVAERDAASSVRLAVNGLRLGEYREDDELYPLVLRSGEVEKADLAGLSGLWVLAGGGTAVVPITHVSSIEATWLSGVIHRRNLERVVTVRAYTDGMLPQEIIRSAAPQIAEIPLPAGYRIEYGGENEARNEAFGDIGRLSVLMLVLIYLLIAAQFYSLTKPFIVLLSAYLALAGALLGLFITGTPLGFMALLGVISLAGIVVRNGIMLIEFIETGQQQGLNLIQAIGRAGRLRLRPILLSSVTTAGALIPMAVMGDSLWRPMAITIISGVLFSTLLTLFVVPNAYLLITESRRKRQPVRADNQLAPTR